MQCVNSYHSEDVAKFAGYVAGQPCTIMYYQDFFCKFWGWKRALHKTHLQSSKSAPSSAGEYDAVADDPLPAKFIGITLTINW